MNNDLFNASLEKIWQMLKQDANLSNTRPKVLFSTEIFPAFYSKEITDVFLSANSTFTVKTSLPSLIGYEGVIPRGMFKSALSAHFELSSNSAIDFFNIFNNRYYRLYCQTKLKYDLCSQLEEESFYWNSHRLGLTKMLANLMGFTNDYESLPLKNLVQYCGVLGMKLTSLDMLKNLLDDYFNASFEVIQGDLDYLPLLESSITKIGYSGMNNQLSMSALLGKRMPMIGHKLIIRILPSSYEHYLSIRHNKKMVCAIKCLVRAYLGLEIKTLFYMKVDSQYLTRIKLCSDHKKALNLGQTAWIGKYSKEKIYFEIPLTGD